MMISVGVFIILFFIGQFGDLAIAGYGTAIRYEQLYLLPVLGLNTAVLAMVGQNYGAKKIIRVNKIYNKALLYGCGFMFVSGFIIFFTADFAVNLFTDNKEVIIYGTTYLKITALMAPIYPIFFISNGFFMSLKKSENALISNLIRNIFLPLFAFYLAKYINGSFNTFFWSYCYFNWFYVLILFFFVTFYIKRKLN